MDISRLCYNCFKEKPDSSGPCPYCGFDLEENAKKYPVALRAGTVLNGRYLIGRVLGQGGFGITYLAWDTKLGARMAVKEYMPNEIAARIGTTVSVAMKKPRGGLYLRRETVSRRGPDTGEVYGTAQYRRSNGLL